MPIEVIKDPKELALVLSIRKCRSDDEIIRDLNTALSIISGSLCDSSLYSRGIDLSGKWRLGHDAFNPWGSANVNAWARLGAQPTNLIALRTWLEELEKMLARHLSEKYSPIFEANEVLLGEVPLSVLAVMHLAFVPIYMRFLDVWENADPSQQNSIMTEIVQAHGRCSEVEDLLLKLVAHSGGGDLIEYALRPELEKLYGDFPKSELFRRMVEVLHSMAPEFQDNTGKRYIFSYHPSWPELTEAAQIILAELDAG